MLVCGKVGSTPTILRTNRNYGVNCGVKTMLNAKKPLSDRRVACCQQGFRPLFVTSIWQSLGTYAIKKGALCPFCSQILDIAPTSSTYNRILPDTVFAAATATPLQPQIQSHPDRHFRATPTHDHLIRDGESSDHGCLPPGTAAHRCWSRVPHLSSDGH